MKLPKARTVERILRMVPLVSDILPHSGDSNSELLRLTKKVKEQDTALYAKKNEIEILKERIRKLEETLDKIANYNDI
jgi:peptidoglycan hydrolase CwlO-like protein